MVAVVEMMEDVSNSEIRFWTEIFNRIPNRIIQRDVELEPHITFNVEPKPVPYI